MSAPTLGVGDSLVLSVYVSNASRLYVNTAKGSPYVTLSIGTATRKALFVGTRNNSLQFIYTVQAVDADSAITPQSFVMNNAVIKNENGLIIDSLSLPVADAASFDYTTATQATSIRHTRPGIDAAIAETLGGVDGSTLFGNLQPGIGDGDDLLVKVEVDHIERWIPRIHKGWFYIGDNEYYLFVRKFATTASPYSSLSEVQLVVPEDSPEYDITEVATYGPVIVKTYEDGVTSRLIQVSGSTRVVEQLTAGEDIAGTNLKRYPLNGIQAELYRTNCNDKMREVSGRDMILDDLHYAIEYDYSDTWSSEYGSIDELVDTYVVVSGSSSVFASYIATDVVKDPGTPWDQLLQAEVCRVSSDYTIRAMYKDVATAAAVYPKVYALHDGDRTEITPTAISVNVLTLPTTYLKADGSSGTISPGDRVGLTYYVDNSFVLLDTGSATMKVKAYTNPAVVDSLVIEYEGSTIDYWDGVDLLRNSNSYVQLNPIKDGVYPGFLYLVDGKVTKKPAQIGLFLSSAIATVDTVSAQPVSLLAIAVDSDGNPVQDEALRLTAESFYTITRGSGVDVVENVPSGLNISRIEYAGLQVTGFTQQVVAAASGYNLEITWSSTAVPRGMPYRAFSDTALGEILQTFPRGAITDWKGHMRARWIPNAACNTIFTCQSTSATGVTRTIELTQVTKASVEPRNTAAETTGTRIWVRLTEDADSDGAAKVVAYLADVSGGAPVQGAQITFVSQLGKFRNSLPIETNADGVAINYYGLVDGDHIYAQYGTVVSNVVVIGGDNVV